MQTFDYQTLLNQQQSGERPYLEFLKVESMSMGLYVLLAGSVDGQQPHTEDEVYYVVRGRGRFVCEGEDVAVEAGSILFVAAHADHRFHSIEDDLHILVFFAPAEYSNAGSKASV
jgi:mannose-6-phosphate isomerase-like protein (cupin superfamily)